MQVAGGGGSHISHHRGVRRLRIINTFTSMVFGS